MRSHFRYRPQVVDYTVLIDTSTKTIQNVAASNNQTHHSEAIRAVLQGISQKPCKNHQEHALCLEQEDKPESEDEEESEEEEIDEESKRRQERLQATKTIAPIHQAERLQDFQSPEGVPLYSAMVKKPGSASPVIQISTQPPVMESAATSSQAVSVPIQSLISNKELQAKC